jgi:hypothetical protein
MPFVSFRFVSFVGSTMLANQTEREMNNKTLEIFSKYNQ